MLKYVPVTLGVIVFLLLVRVSVLLLSDVTSSPEPTPTQSMENSSDTLGVQNTLVPANILDLTNWKLTLPIGSAEKPAEILQPELATYKLSPWFVVADSGDGIRFKAPVNAVTTSGSNYPRSELREMKNNGKDKASWSSTSGKHTMYLDQAITAHPKKKKHVVIGQIHDAKDDVIVIRLEYPKLYVNVDGSNKYTLDANYTLGKRLTVKFEVEGGKTKIYYNDSATPAYTLSKNYSGAYFKAGAYTQSNCSREGSALCTDDNYGEVVIYRLNITH